MTKETQVRPLKLETNRHNKISEDNRISFSQFRRTRRLNKHALLEYQARFVDIKKQSFAHYHEMIKGVD
jgi:hypothetical protein